MGELLDIKLKSYSLYISIIISLIANISLSLLVIYLHLSEKSVGNYKNKLKLLNASQSSIQYMKEKHSDISFIKTFMKNEGIGFSAQKKKWGLFDLINTKCYIRSDTLAKGALLGAQLGDKKIALFLSNTNKGALQVTEKTSINGDIFVPSGKILGKGKISNQKAREKITGNIYEARQPAAEFGRKMIYNNLASQSVWCPDTARGKIFNSFSDSTLLIKLKSSYPSAESYSGNIILLSDSIIIIDRNKLLNNIIICAPSIIFKPGVTARLQAFATDSIIIGAQSRFSYPSVISCEKSSKDKQYNPTIIIHDHCQIEGNIITAHEIADPFMPLIKISKSLIIGQIYNTGRTEFTGKLIGEMYTQILYSRTDASVCYNCLDNLIIDKKSLPENLAFPPIINNSNKNEIIRWLE